MSTLTEIMIKHGSDKGGGHHNYTEYYEKLLGHLRNDKINLLEIGIGTMNPNIPSSMAGTPGGYTPGSSLRGWKEYFPNGRIYGCDIDKEILFFDNRIQTFFLDQTSPKSIDEAICKVDRTYDIIVDDGLHDFNVNCKVMKQIFHKLNDDGYYIIEDILPYLYNPEHIFTEGIEWKYIRIPNEKNNFDNNILVARKKGKFIPDY